MIHGQLSKASQRCATSHDLKEASFDNSQFIARAAARIASEGQKWSYKSILRALQEEYLFQNGAG